MRNLAFDFYADMVLQYARYEKGGVDKKACYNRFLNDAIALAKLAEPNPFPAEKQMNAAVRPGKAKQVVTAVAIDNIEENG